MSKHHGFYILLEDCGNLDDNNRCTIYDDPKKPGACSKFEPGSNECLAARSAFGYGTPEQQLAAISLEAHALIESPIPESFS